MTADVLQKEQVYTADNVPIYCSYDKIIKLNELKPNPKNPNTHPENQIELLGQILKQQGWRTSITVSIRSGYIVRGHGRLMAALAAGLTEAPVDYQFYENSDSEWADLIADNRISELSEIDKNLLNDLLNEIDLTNIPAELTGYTQGELTELETAINDLAAELSEVDDVIPEVEEEYFSQLGDKWILGEHVLVCGDSTKAETYNLLLDGDKVDMILTDPPYNVDYEGVAGKIKNDKMNNDNFYQFLFDAFTNMRANIKDGGSYYVWHADSEGLNFRKAIVETGFLFKECLIWVKNQMVMGRSDYQWKHEPCLYGWAAGASHYFIDDRTQTTVLEYKKPLKSELHPTMKPLELFERLIMNSSFTGQLVLDPFGGSGTTLICCENLKRKARTIEFDPRFADVIVKRWLNLTKRKDEVKCIRNGEEIDISEFLGALNENS